MTATTLGDLFPDLRNATCGQEKKCKSGNKITRQGTAERLKALYPEIESWHPVFATQAWFRWLSENNMELVEPDGRDERFPEYLVGLIKEKMVEMGSWR
ncbi:hypothetical protein [Buttiauxella agrestis]|uniref:Uncharacterized protein n=1 Tax=Buttiauxella agrestis ATCC 33320 TaxID=1006004 RepID=A0A085FZ15_9ENTR|nr:hypothetical protein [Buttiauxella agrestis]KFC76710.1 hypothetical protein GBAG_4345 [Buttiauxella agrestis ATCC 33320]